MDAQHTCKYCGKRCDTAQGLTSHYELKKLCRQRMHEAYRADSDSDDTDDSNMEDEGLVNLDNIWDDDSEELPADPPQTSTSPAGSPPESIPPPRTVLKKRPPPTVEEVEDEDDRYVQDFPPDLNAGARLARCETVFQKWREEQRKNGQQPWYPMDSEEEWELARWLMTSGPSRQL
ncbi:hypothetical protein GGX14DRAFT_580553 [Mycena pura]|uniref:C2H2-type domain-containing protein n=1 Tax=Mycena pura TaxID=153505 RepID=A0AAD6USL2_9AGAR|nr:hypothetical protein GGX14DRAFT_580553 [Mycena pura]